MTTARTIGRAVGNGRFQDELCDALAPLLSIERCRTDRELLALAAQHVLGGAIVGHELLGLDRHVFPALVRNDIPTVLLVLERDIPRRLASLALDGGAARGRCQLVWHHETGGGERRKFLGLALSQCRTPT